MHLYYTRVEGESSYMTWDFNPERINEMLWKFGETVGRIESHRFSNKGVVKFPICQKTTNILIFADWGEMDLKGL